MLGYAVVDLETSGLSARKGSEVVEVAVVHLSPNGAYESHWDSLVKPSRGVGPSHIHKIRTQDVTTAPAFSDIAGTLATLFEGRVLVAHNAKFDIGFLQTEFERVGWDQVGFPYYCTKNLCRFIEPAPRKKNLGYLLNLFEIENFFAHAALGDAWATARLFQKMISSLTSFELVTAGFIAPEEAVTTKQRLSRFPNVDLKDY